MGRFSKSKSLEHRRQLVLLKLADVSVRLTESLIRLADSLTEKVEAIDVLAPPDVSRMALREAMTTLHQCVKVLELFDR